MAQSSITTDTYVTTENMVKDRGGITTYSGELPASAGTAYKKGDTLVSNIRPYLQKIWLADRDGACSKDVLVFRSINTDSLLPEFLHLLLWQKDFFDYDMSTFTGTGRPRGDKDELLKYPIPVPTLSEQRALIDDFNRLTDEINSKRQQIAALKESVKSRFVEVFGDPVDGKKWPFVRLEDLCTKLGSGATPRGGKTAYKAEGVPLVRSTNVHNGRFVWKDLACIDDEQAAKLEGVTLMKGDVLLNITGASVARSCLLPDELAGGRVNQHVSIVRVDQKRMLPVLLNTVLISDSYQRLLLNGSRAAGATREAITKEALKRMTVPLPPLELQQEFASFVAQVDKSQFALEQEVDALSAERDALLDRFLA